MAHPCGDPNRATQCRAFECRIKFPQNQRCRTKIALHPANKDVTHFSRPPCRTFLSFAAGRGQGGVSRRAGGGYRGTFGFRKRIALQRGIAATVTPVALLCATKLHRKPGENGRTRSKSKNPVETAPQSCRFLSLVVVKRALNRTCQLICCKGAKRAFLKKKIEGV